MASLIPKKCKPVLFLVGPTGSGKTELALSLAKRIGGEIVSCDSMLVYKGMDIGTAKPTRAERKRIPHHLIDLVSPRAQYSVHAHRKRVLALLPQILRRLKVPILVGGSGLYIEAVWKGLSSHPGKDSGFRKNYESLQKETLEVLYRKLQQEDPRRAEKIHPHDRQRIVRALEILEISGKSPTEWFAKRISLEDEGYSVRVFGIERDREGLYARINHRVEKMFKQDLVKEVMRLAPKGFSKTSGQALGYKEILEWLRHCPGSPRNDVMALIQTRTRQFAKRQLTWLRREKKIHWISWNRTDSPKTVCDKMTPELKRWAEIKPYLS